MKGKSDKDRDGANRIKDQNDEGEKNEGIDRKRRREKVSRGKRPDET